eukprot:7380960-Prymnesium_polylepis.1
MQRGFCQCSADFKPSRALPVAECGPPCPGEEHARPPSYCAESPPGGGPARDAVYTQSTGCDSLGAAIQLETPLAPVEGNNLWKGVIKIPRWQEGAIIDLDWGVQHVELGARHPPPCHALSPWL